MKEYDREEYLKQLEIVFSELKKLKRIKGISGDMDALDELRMINEFLIASSYDWEIISKPFMIMAKEYFLHTNISMKKKEDVWDLIVTFISTITKLSKYSVYIKSSQTFCEEILTEVDNGNILEK